MTPMPTERNGPVGARTRCGTPRVHPRTTRIRPSTLDRSSTRQHDGGDASSEPLMHARSCFAISAAILLAAAIPAAAQKAPSILESYQRARALLELAVNAHGGIDALRAARTARVRTVGWDYHPTQSRRVAPPFASTVRNSDAMITLDRDRKGTV